MHRFHQEEVDMHQADLVRLTALEEGTVALYEQQLAEMEALRIDHADRLATLEKADTLLRQQQTELDLLRPLAEANARHHQQAAGLDLLRTACADRLATIEQSDFLLHQQQAELDLLRLLAETNARHHQLAAELDLLRTACADRLAISKKSDALLHQQQAELQQLRAMPSPLHQEPPPPADEPNSNQRQRG
ncbi:MAG: hypothetical protein ACK55F_09020, partial [Acidobacteriota bacterium]